MREAFFALAGATQRLRDAGVDFTVALVRMRQAYWGRGYDDDTRRAGVPVAGNVLYERAFFEQIPSTAAVD